MFKSKLFWGGVLLCSVALLFGILIHNANQPQETITIYKTVTPEQRVKSRASDKPIAQTNNAVDKTQTVSTSMDSDGPKSTKDFTSEDTQLSEAELQAAENISPIETEVKNATEPQEERFYGLTLAEIQEKIPVLEAEIRTNLTKAVELYAELRSTDGMASKSPPYFSVEIATWRDETWKEVKRLFHAVSHTGKIMRYTSYLKVTGGNNPLLPGGWIAELMEPLPMRVEYNGTFQ
ncbi:hypothetical protein F4009_02410 [Candidatus Poribacteria bacterium]|nr:hypothetical protein [Candidatus Poribacteria bacterium]MYH83764.1 hypothetical protein [Candidatus Poribacteria bacterium]MYK92854.1 hypothetical protein [Candidatus Poribacteria bacterium]